MNNDMTALRLIGAVAVGLVSLAAVIAEPAEGAAPLAGLWINIAGLGGLWFAARGLRIKNTDKR